MNSDRPLLPGWAVPSGSQSGERSLSFFVPGKPETAGSKKMGFKREGSEVIGRVIIDDNPKGRGWKRAVAAHAMRQVGRPMLKGPVSMRLWFILQRPLAHFVGRKRENALRADAPGWPAVKPDTLKLARAVEDGLTGVLYVDDAQIVVQVHSKQYGPEPGVHVEVIAL